MGRLADQVSDLEQECDDLKEANTSLEQSLDEVEGELEEVTNRVSDLQEFYDWVLLAYPEIIKDYGCVKIIEEKANGI
jgi:predicted nuclease with TOPRIM domain